MKAQELRIGNLVEYNNCIATVYSIQSPEPTNNRFNNKYVITLSLDGLIATTIEDVKPIPLSEEWLERLGCRNTPLNEKMFSCGILPMYLNEDGSVDVYRIDISGKHTNYLTSLKYLHQLQNLYYAITGEELEIINSVN